MKTIEQALSRKRVFEVNNFACMQHADHVRAYVRPTEIHPWSKLPKEIQLIFKVAFISVCHQFNWDFLQSRLANNLLSNDINIISRLSEISTRDISDWLSDYPKQDRVRAKERAKILRDVGKTLTDKFHADERYFYQKCSGAKLGTGEFREIMDSFLGYRTDLLRKKTNVLTHDLEKEGIINFSDPENIEPAIDYHIMRVYLRTGRVTVAADSAKEFLTGAPRPRPALVKQLRMAVAEAEKMTAYYANLSVADLNYIEWQIGRGLCTNSAPVCQTNAMPSTLPTDVAQLCRDTCPYIGSCHSHVTHHELILLEEPNFISKDY